VFTTQYPPQYFIDRYNEYENNINASDVSTDLAREVRRNFTAGLGMSIQEGGYGISEPLLTRGYIERVMKLYIDYIYGEEGTGTLRFSDVGDAGDLYQMVLKFSALDFACMYGALDYLGSKKNDETYIQYNVAGDKVEKITEEGQNLVLSRMLEQQNPSVSDFRVMYFALISGKIDFNSLEANDQRFFFTALQLILNKADSKDMVNREIPESHKFEDIYNQDLINGIIGGISGLTNMETHSAHLARLGLSTGYWRELVSKTLPTNKISHDAINNLLPGAGR
ncbi:MAG: hypothetical protein QG570_96, partial [Patescibacteria group bacterium]|nr:hypothetical protein [Patescibacteria group bacterium]